MARPRKTQNDQPTGTVAARHAAEFERQQAARAARAAIIAETTAAHKATAKRLANKPTDTRTIAPVDPNAGIP